MHQTKVIETASRLSMWKCSCGMSSGGKWSRSPEEALKKALKHERKNN